MKKYTIEFYSNNGYKFGESTNEYEDFAAAKLYAKQLLQSDATSIEITYTNRNEKKINEVFKVADISKVVIIEN